MSCIDDCTALKDAYLQMLAGKTKCRVRYNDMWVEYRQNAPGDMDRLRDAYTTMRLQCPEAMATLPDLSRSQRALRGPPAGVRSYE